MNTAAAIPTAPSVSSFNMLKAMTAIGLMCALLIVLTYEGTLPRITKNKAEALEKAIFRVIPGITAKETFIWDGNDQFVLPTEEGQEGQAVYAGYDDKGNLQGIALEASGIGFADIIRIIYGYDPEKEAVIGFYVLESKETPGLGDKIEKDDNFLSNFEALDVELTADGTSVKNKIIPVKAGEKEQNWEIDCITGATISSKAIANILSESTEVWMPRLVKHLDTFKNKS